MAFRSGTFPASAFEPNVVRTPWVSVRSLREKGRPWSRPRSLAPWARALVRSAGSLSRFLPEREQGNALSHGIQAFGTVEHRIEQFDGRELPGAGERGGQLGRRRVADIGPDSRLDAPLFAWNSFQNEACASARARAVRARCGVLEVAQIPLCIGASCCSSALHPPITPRRRNVILNQF